MKDSSKLDEMVVQIEFLLISVIQGVALAALASSAASPVVNLQYEYWPYIIIAFLFILIFWSQAIMHVLSFIRWPIDMAHNFLYFLASLVEVMAFNELTNPLKWFGFIFSFVLVTAFLYLYDLQLIKRCKNDFIKTRSGKNLWESIYNEQIFETKVFVPLGLLYTIGAFLAILFYPNIFIKQHYHLIFVGGQVIFGLIILITSLKAFKKRLRLIATQQIASK